MINSIKIWALKPHRAESLGIFRVLFGLINLWEVFYLYRIGFLENFIFGPNFLFNYEFLPLHPISRIGMEILLAGLALSCVLITLGYFYRIAICYFFLVFSYFFLLDKGLYNNHIFLISLISFLLIFIDADSSYSIGKKSKKLIPQWQIRILQLQIAFVFFFGGLAKINPYWIGMHPVKEILEMKSTETGIEFINSSSFQYIIMLGGICFDILIPFLLWIKKTRPWAIIAALVFNLSNSWIFNDINIFPYFMIAALLLFLDESEFSKLPFISLEKISEKTPKFKLSKPKMAILSFYILFQLYLPLRHYMYPGYVDWTGDGQHFAWRMKIQHRDIEEMKFAIFDNEKKEIHEIDPKNHLNSSQYHQLSLSPQMIVQFAYFLKDIAQKKEGMKSVMVKSKVKVTFNGTKPSYIFDPTIDLIQGSKSYKYFDEWIEPAPLLNN